MATLDMLILGKRLREQREKRGWTLAKVWGETGLDLPTLSRLEGTGMRGVPVRRPKRGIAGETLLRLALVFGCSADYLLGLADDPHPSRAPVAPGETP